MQKMFPRLFIKVMLALMATGTAFAAGDVSPAPGSAAPASMEAAPPSSGFPFSGTHNEEQAAPSVDVPASQMEGGEESALGGEGHSATEPAPVAPTAVHDDAAHSADGTAGHAEHSATSGLPQMDPTWFPSQIFWMAITFAYLYVVFSRKILPDLSSTIDNRRNQIKGDLDSAQKLKEEAAAVQHAYEAELNEARNRCTAMFTEVEESIRRKTAKKMDGFALRAEKELRAAETGLEEAKRAVLADMNAIAAEVSSLAAQKIVGIEPDLDQAKTVIKKLGLRAA